MKEVIKGIVFILLFCFAASAAMAQSHNAIPVEQEALYDFLDMAQLRNLIPVIPAARPYPRSMIAQSLKELNTHRGSLSVHEQAVLDDYMARFVEYRDKPFNQDGNFRFPNDSFPVTLGGYVGGVVSTDMGHFKKRFNGAAYAGLYAFGDMGKYVSWGLDFNGSAHLCDNYPTASSYGPEGWEPYTYTKTWDGGLHPLATLSQFWQMPVDLAFGYRIYPELAASFWDNRVNLRFARMRHSWGVGEGSLHLNANALPFFALETSFTPIRWLSISALTGVLEYGEQFRTYADYGIKSTSREQQNMFSIMQVEAYPFPWLYLSFFDAAVYLKRPEPAYLFPFMSRFLAQNNIGDYDNLMMGGSLALSWPGLLRGYFSVFLDEARFNSPDFLHNPANMYSLQTGIQAPIPGLPWSKLTFQYTRIEPFTYTHYYLKNAPGYTPPDSDGDGHPDYAMDTGYMNGGESLGYGLEPNSDEFLLQVKSQFRRGINLHGHYRLIRHGYPGSVRGSTFEAWGFDPADPSITPDLDPDGAYYDGNKKYFLKDGVYEWYHIVSMGATLDTRRWNESVQFGLDYSLVFLYYTNYASNGHYKPLNTGAFTNQVRNIVTFSASISPW